MLNSTALPNADLAFALADNLDAGRIHDPAAPSLLRAWNEGWTWRQAAKVRALVDHADPIPGETRAVPPGRLR